VPADLVLKPCRQFVFRPECQHVAS
jgi:hypothetical protein